MGVPMKALPTHIEDLMVVDTTPFKDERGAFARLFCTQELSPFIGDRRIVQINHSRTSELGAVRGLHFQNAPHAEMKLVRCLKGRVWDVAVDLRKGSKTFLQWHAEELSADNMRMMLIPEGFAHGFQVLEANTELLYLHTAAYAPASEGGLRYNDPALGIKWPMAATEVSKRDAVHRYIDSNFQGISL